MGTPCIKYSFNPKICNSEYHHAIIWLASNVKVNFWEILFLKGSKDIFQITFLKNILHAFIDQKDIKAFKNILKYSYMDSFETCSRGM